MEELFYVVVLDDNEVIYHVGDYPKNEAIELTNHLNGLLSALGLSYNDSDENNHIAVYHPTKIF